MESLIKRTRQFRKVAWIGENYKYCSSETKFFIFFQKTRIIPPGLFMRCSINLQSVLNQPSICV